MFLCEPPRSSCTPIRKLEADGSHGARRYPLTDLTVAAAAQHSASTSSISTSTSSGSETHLGTDAHWISAPA
jgi:hypothetical protein